MRKDLTDITVVLDRSGSMAACQKEAESGLNQFIEAQKKAPGHALFTLVQFDTDYEFVHNGRRARPDGEGCENKCYATANHQQTPA